MRVAATLLLLFGLASGAASQTVYEVSQESAPGAGDFDSNVVGTITAFDGLSQTAVQHYAKGGSNAGYNGPLPQFSDMGTDNVSMFFVENSDGLHFYTILGSISQNGTQYSTTTTGPFASLAVRDEGGEHTLTGSTLASDGQIARNKGDGFAAGLSGGALDPIYFDVNSVTNGLAKPTAGMQALSADGSGGVDTPLALTLEADRRVRFAPVTLEIGAAPPVNAPGWRLLSAPVAGLDVLDLADINLVLGVQAGAVNAAQFESAGVINARGDLAGNLFHAYEGLESIRNAAGTADSAAVIYRPVPDADYTFQPGMGIWWYWYDQTLPNSTLTAAYGSGVGVSYNLNDDAFGLRASGLVADADVSVSFPLADVLPSSFDGDGDGSPDDVIPNDYFYMGGNPFAQPFNVDGISATNGTVQGLVYAWDPTANSGAGGHVPLARSGGLDGSGDDAAVWQGLMIEVTPDGASGPTITYAAAMRDAAASPPFYGKTSGLTASGATPEIRFTLSGARGEDRAWLRFLPDAEKGFERHDGSSFSSAAARIAFPVSDRTEGARRAMRHLAMNALPDGSAAPLPRTVNVPMDLAVSEAGTFTLSWEDALSDGWTAYLVDRETGDRVKMWRQTSYTFDASEGDWSRRFLVTVRPASGAVSVAPEAASKAEAETRVGEVYPNPTSGAGRVEVVLGAEQTVRIAVIDALGREVAVAHDGPLAEGSTAVALPVASLAAGTYVVRVTGEGVAETRRLTVTR